MGPGVTPTLMWEAPGLAAFNSSNQEHVVTEQRANEAFDRIMAGDRICAQER
jgi:hypothetical protein